jgi:hypothetical protein
MHRPKVIVEENSAIMAMACGSNIRANLEPARKALLGVPPLTLLATGIPLLPVEKVANSLGFPISAIFFTKNVLSFRSQGYTFPVIFFTKPNKGRLIPV